MRKIIISTWNWKTGMEKTEIPMPKIRNGYVSKPAWKQFEEALKNLNGRKVRIRVE